MPSNINAFRLILLVMIGRVLVKAMRVDMQRVWSRNYITHAVHRSNARLKTLEAAITGQVSHDAPDSLSAPVKSGQRVGDQFMMTMGIGTPPVKINGIVDTGSDLIWTKCQRHHIFDPAKSSTYNKLSCSSPLCSALPTKKCTPDCDYTYSYGYKSKTAGVLSKETFTMWDSNGNAQAVRGVAFGCSHGTEGDGFSEADGLVGLGRGSLSLTSQIGLKFSYCLTSYYNKSTSVETISPLFFCSAAELRGSNVKSTPMVKNSGRPELDTFHYVSVKGISVGTSVADIPAGALDIGRDGNGGFIVDSGTTITYLSPDAFDAVARALDSALGWEVADGSRYGYDRCYSVPLGATQNHLPDMTFHLGGDADYVVEGKHNFALVDQVKGLLCVMILKMAVGSGAKAPSILGNFQQQNMHILYDNDIERISFAPAICGQLSQPQFDQQFLVSVSQASNMGRTGLMVLFIFQFVVTTLS